MGGWQASHSRCPSFTPSSPSHAPPVPSSLVSSHRGSKPAILGAPPSLPLPRPMLPPSLPPLYLAIGVASQPFLVPLLPSLFPVPSSLVSGHRGGKPAILGAPPSLPLPRPFPM